MLFVVCLFDGVSCLLLDCCWLFVVCLFDLVCCLLFVVVCLMLFAVCCLLACSLVCLLACVLVYLIVSVLACGLVCFASGLIGRSLGWFPGSVGCLLAWLVFVGWGLLGVGRVFE